MHPSTTPLQPISGNQTRCSLSTTTNDSLRRHSAPKVIIPTKDPIRPKNPSSNPSFHHDFHRLDLPSRSRGSTELSGSTADPDKLLDHKTLRPTTSPPTRREQPLRSTKIMPSIEDAENQRISPAFGSQEFEAEWVPSEGAESNILSFGSSRSTSSQQSPSKRLSITRRKEAHSSSRSRLDPPSNERHRRLVKSELPDTETIYPGIEASVNYKALCPTRDFETQKQRLEEHGFFEWHEADVAFARMKQTEQEMEEKLATEKAAYERLLERSRKDRPSRRSRGRLEGYCEPSKESKRAHTGFERKSQRKIFNQNGNDVDSPIVRTPNSLQGTHSLERDQVGHSGKSSQGCIDPQFEVSKIAASSSGTPVFNLAPDGPAHVRREFGHLSTRFSSRQPKGSGLASMGGPRPDKLRQSLDSRFPHLKRREVEVPLDKCKCDELHWYFAEPGLQFPDKDSFCGSIQEFLAHASQVADCGAHDPVLVDNCRQIIMSETYCSCVRSFNFWVSRRRC